MTLVLLLFLALTASWTELVQCEEQGNIDPDSGSEDSILEERNPIAGGEEGDPENRGDVTGSGDETTQDNVDLGSPRKSDSSSGLKIEPTDMTELETSTGDLAPIIIPLMLILIIIATIVCGVMIYRRRTTKATDTREDHYLDNEDHEKVPMPMFDDDIPSVMELEMEDLENWMAKDRGMNVDTGQI